MSPIDYSGGMQLKEFSPKVGESKVIHIRSSVKVEDPTGQDEQNFRSMTKNFGYRFELTLTNGRLFLLNVWKLFFAFRDAGVEDGDLVQIEHPGQGTYVVTILEKGTGIGVTVPDLEKEKYLADKRANGGQAPAPTTQQATPATTPATVVTPSVQPAPVNVAPPVQQTAVPPASVAVPPVQPATVAPVNTTPPVPQPEEEMDLPF